METSIRSRVEEVRRYIGTRHGSMRAFADAVGMGVSRISKALSDDLASHERLSPIERAIQLYEEEQGERRPAGDYGEVKNADLTEGEALIVLHINGVPVREIPIRFGPGRTLPGRVRVDADAGAGIGRPPGKG